MRLHVAAGIFHTTNIGTQKWRGRENLLVMINRHVLALLARRGYAKEIRNRYASAVPDYGEDNVRAAGQAGTHSVQHPVIESGRTREQSDRNVEH